MVGTATETVIRALSDFKDRNIVDIKGKKIIIQNARLLQQVANVYD
jgi:CRP/FNR family transcriptional regulator